MIGKSAIRLLALTMLLQLAACAIDTSPLDGLRTQIEQVEAEIIAAQERGGISTTLIDLHKDLASLNKQLEDPQMAFLVKYSNMQLAQAEAQTLMQQIGTNLAEADISTLMTEHDLDLQTLEDAESAYNDQDYGTALSLISGIEASVTDFPASLLSASAESLTALKSSMAAAQATPSTAAMLEDSQKRMNKASGLYTQAASKLRTDELDEADALLEGAREASTDAFGLLARARGQGGNLLDGFEMLLIFGPLAAMIGLIFYFRTQFKKQVISSSVSTESVLAHRESIIDRFIIVNNPESSPVRMRVFDAPPKALKVSDFKVPPKSVSGNEIVWEFELPPGDRKDLDYKITVPRLDSGWKLRVHAVTLSYEIGGRQKKYVGRPSEVRIL